MGGLEAEVVAAASSGKPSGRYDSTIGAGSLGSRRAGCKAGLLPKSGSLCAGLDDTAECMSHFRHSNRFLFKRSDTNPHFV